MINDVALAGVSGEVFTLIAQRLKRESPFSHTDNGDSRQRLERLYPE